MGLSQSFGLNADTGSSLSSGTLPDARHASTDTPTTSAMMICSRVLMVVNRQRSTIQPTMAAMSAVTAIHHNGNTEGNWVITYLVSICFGFATRYNIGMDAQLPSPENAPPDDAIARAIEYGVDITLLTSNLQLTPTERIHRAQRALDSVVAFQLEVRKWRQRQEQVG